MKNPITVNCPADTWKKVSTNIKSVCLWENKTSPGKYIYTYRLTGQSAPTLQSEGKPIFVDSYYETIKSGIAIDVYIMAVGNSGKVRVDEFLFLPSVDGLSSVGINIDFNHHEIHEGDHYFYSRVTTLASGATGNWVLTSPTKDLHFVYSIDSDFAGFTFETIEDITSDSDGTLLEINNNNRPIGDDSTAILRYNPSNIVTVGKRVLRDGSFGTATNPAKSSAGSVVRSDEVILKKGKKYLLTVTNKATANNPINVGMTWYEH